MPARKGLLAPQNTFLDTIATRFDGTHSNFVLGNAKITRLFPIVYCSDGFCELTGYSRAQIMQRSCACDFLFGKRTDQSHRAAIWSAIESKSELKLELILYKSSGIPFWCLLDIVPIQDEKHEVVLFLCSHKDITRQKLHQRDHLKHHQQQQQLALTSSAATVDHPGHAHPDGQPPPTSNIPPPQPLEDEFAEFGLSSTDCIISSQPATAADHAHPNQFDPLGLEPEVNSSLSSDECGLEHGGVASGGTGDKQTASQYSRRRSRAVLYQLSGHYGYRRSVNMKSKLKLNNRITLPEYKTTTIEKQRLIVSHYGVAKSCWDWLILVVSFYVAIVVPYNATFKEHNLFRASAAAATAANCLHSRHTRQTDDESSDSNSNKYANSSQFYSFAAQLSNKDCEIDAIDIFVEFVFLIDVLLNFRTTFVNRKGEVVTKPKIIFKHYVRGWFLVDFCAALPFDIACGMNLYTRDRLGIDLNLLKLIRLLRLLRLLQKMDRYSQYSYIILTMLMLIFSLLAHWCACIWYVIAVEELSQNPPDWHLGWIHQLSDKLQLEYVNATDTLSSYITALYFTTSSLTSVGFGNVSANTNSEKIFSIVIMLIGALMHAVVFGNVTALIRVMYARRSNYQTRLRDLKDFFRLHQLPRELQQRMSDYFQTTWSLNHGIETSEILKEFPEELRGDVSLHLHREVLTLPIFENAPQGFLKSLARHIESKFCCPTEYLIHRHDALSYLYLVCNGSMEVLQDDMVVGILGKGDLVGYDVSGGCGGGSGPTAPPAHADEPAASSNAGGSQLVKSSSDLKALTYCDLKCIHIGGLLEVLKLYPEFADTFHDEIIHDLSFNLREQHDELAHLQQLHADQVAAPDSGEEDEDAEEEEDDDDDDEDEEEDEEEEDEEEEDEDDQDDQDDDQDDNQEHELDTPQDADQDDDQQHERETTSSSEDQNDRDNAAKQPPDGSARPRHTGNERPDHSPDLDRGQKPPAATLQRRRRDTNHRLALLGAAGQRTRRTRGRPPESPPGGARTNHQDELISLSSCATLPVTDRTQIVHQDELYDDIQSETQLGELADRSETGASQLRRRRPNARLLAGRQIASDETPSCGGPPAAPRSTLKSAFGGRGAGEPRPPISFDLSKNTTAIVDRRRRSAGCIALTRPIVARPLVQRKAAPVAPSNGRYGKRCYSSSLLHIGEEMAPPPPPPLDQNSKSAGAGRHRQPAPSTGSQLIGGRRRRSAKVAKDTGGQRAQDARLRQSYSNEDFEQIDAHITASVRKLRQEFRHELNQAVEQLARLVADSRTGLRPAHSSASLRGSLLSPATDGATCAGLTRSVSAESTAGELVAVQAAATVTCNQVVAQLESVGSQESQRVRAVVVGGGGGGARQCLQPPGSDNDSGRASSSLSVAPSGGRQAILRCRVANANEAELQQQQQQQAEEPQHQNYTAVDIGAGNSTAALRQTKDQKPEIDLNH